jgi:CheY-like chemotaxis protein
MDAIRQPVNILVADDDPDDCELIRDALAASHMRNPLYFVRDGEELLEFLRREGRHRNIAQAPRPGLILLDLNMPRMDGRDALRVIKSDPGLRMIPIVVMTTSDADEDVYRSYEMGANSYITKPMTFDGLVGTMRALGAYWFKVVDLPIHARTGSNA